METSFIQRASALVIALTLFAGMIAIFTLGRYIRGRWRLDEMETKGGVSIVQTTVLGLFGFILAFTFGLSASRYDSVKNVFIDEANDIGTALLRADLYHDTTRVALRQHFTEYLDAQVSMYQPPVTMAQMKKGKEGCEQARDKIWAIAVHQSKQPGMLIPSNQMIPALNNMFDAGEKRDALLRSTIPDPIIVMLLILALTSSFIAGISTHSVTKKDWVIIFCYVMFTSLVIYITLDLGRPLRGIIKPGAGEVLIREIRQSLHNNK